jgi:hypothetical protein
MRGAPAPHDTSGLQVQVASSDDLQELINDAITFLTAHAGELIRLSKMPGLDDMVIDFGVAWNADYAAHYVRLPPQLSRIAAELNCWLEISFYAVE